MPSGFAGNMYIYPLKVEATLVEANKVAKYTDTVYRKKRRAKRIQVKYGRTL